MSKTNGHPVTRMELREELKKFATQESLNGTQASLDRTQASLDRTRASLDRTQASVNRLAKGMGDLNARVSSIEEKMATRDDINRILKVLDGLATSSRRFWAKLVVHEQRIKALEDR